MGKVFHTDYTLVTTSASTDDVTCKLPGPQERFMLYFVLGLTDTHVKERLRSAPNAVDLAHAVLPQKRTQLRGHLAEAEAELGRAATERELVLLGEVDFGLLSIDRSGRMENEQVVIKGGVQFAGREAHFALRHRWLE